MSRIREAREFFEVFSRTKRSLGLVVWKAFAELGLGPKQVILMRELAKSGSMSQAELARATFTDPAATSRAVQTLVAMGWVRRARNAADQRELAVAMTAAGKGAAKRIETAYGRAASQIIGPLGDRDLREFRRIAGKIVARCGELRADHKDQCTLEGIGAAAEARRPRGRRRARTGAR